MVNYLRFYRCRKQADIAAYLQELSGDEFNTYNISNHLSFHVDQDEKNFWRSLKTKYPDESSMSPKLREALFERIQRY